MKRRKDLDVDAADQFVSDAVATRADQTPRANQRQRRTTGRGKMPAEGYRRTSLDLPDALYKRLKHAAVEQERTLQSIAVEAFTSWLDR
jgi:hypothetical protein